MMDHSYLVMTFAALALSTSEPNPSLMNVDEQIRQEIMSRPKPVHTVSYVKFTSKKVEVTVKPKPKPKKRKKRFRRYRR